MPGWEHGVRGAEGPQPASTSSTTAGHEGLLQTKRTHVMFLVTYTNYLNTSLPLKVTRQDLVKILCQWSVLKYLFINVKLSSEQLSV